MACTKNTYPANLVNTSNKCDVTCKLVFDYNSSAIIVTNDSGTYLSIKYEPSSKKPSVMLSSEPFSASEIRIYTPSLHTYNGEKADAEILVNHNGNNNKHLIISVPILNKNNISSSGSTLARIVKDMAKNRINSFNNPLNINNYTINLNDIIPQKPFYYYQGCSNNKNLFTNTNVKIIAYDNLSGAIHVDSNFINQLKSLLVNPNNITSVNIPKDDLFYHNVGPANRETENIYIDCQPTNEEGEVFIPESEKKSDTNFFENLITINTKELYIIQSLLGLFVMFFILWGAQKIMEKILSKMGATNIKGGHGHPQYP